MKLKAAVNDRRWHRSLEVATVLASALARAVHQAARFHALAQAAFASHPGLPLCRELLKHQGTGTRERLRSVTTCRFVLTATQGLAWESSTSRASPCRKASMKTRRRLFGRPKPAENMKALVHA